MAAEKPNVPVESQSAIRSAFDSIFVALIGLVLFAGIAFMIGLIVYMVSYSKGTHFELSAGCLSASGSTSRGASSLTYHFRGSCPTDDSVMQWQIWLFRPGRDLSQDSMVTVGDVFAAIESGEIGGPDWNDDVLHVNSLEDGQTHYWLPPYSFYMRDGEPSEFIASVGYPKDEEKPRWPVIRPSSDGKRFEFPLRQEDIVHFTTAPAATRTFSAH